MPHGKGRKSRDSGRGAPRSTDGASGSGNAHSGWAVEADREQDHSQLYQFMLQQMAHGLTPGRLETPRVQIKEQHEAVREAIADEALTEEISAKVTQHETQVETGVESEISTNTCEIDDGTDGVSMSTNNIAEVEPRQDEQAYVAVETAVGGDMLDNDSEQNMNVAPTVVEVEGEVEREAKTEVSVEVLQSRLEQLHRRNEEHQIKAQQEIMVQSELQLDELVTLERLGVEYSELYRIAVESLRPEIAVQLGQLKELHARTCDGLRRALSDPWLRRRFRDHPGLVLLRGIYLDESAELERSLFGSEDKETIEASRDVLTADEAPSGDDVLDWLNKSQPIVEITPGLTLRSTAPAQRETPTVREVPNAPRLMISGENNMDWRDLLYDTARAPEGRSGQSDLVFKAIGGGNEIGGACYMLELRRYKKWIMIDAGLRLRENDSRFPDLQKVPRPDLIVVTHAHLDHCGALPYLIQKWPTVPVWCHSDAVPLIEHSLQLLQRQPLSDALIVAPEISLYSAAEIDAVTLEGKAYGDHCRLFDTDLNLVLWRSGHSLGACSISIRGPEDSFFFTGEYAVHDEPSAAAADWPEQSFDVVVASCSGGVRKVFDRPAMQGTLITKVNEIISAGGWAVFPVVEVGRAQDIYQLLAEAMDQQRLARAPIYWDGAQRRLVMLYNLHLDQATLSKGFDYLDEPGCPLNDISRASLSAGPGILLANPGFLQDIVGSALLTRILSTPNSTVFLPSRPDSPLDLKPLLYGIKSDFEMPYYTWPAHPSEDEMVECIKKLSPQAVLLVHGTQESQGALRAELPAGIIRRSLNNGETLSIKPHGG